MAWAVLVGVVLVVLPGALALGTYAVTRERLRSELSPVAFRSVRASWIAASAALLVGASLGAYTYAVTTGRLSPAWPGGEFWLENFLAAYRAASWSLLGGIGLFSLGIAILLADGLHRRV